MTYLLLGAAGCCVFTFFCAYWAIIEGGKPEPREIIGKNLIMGAWVFALIAVGCIVSAGITEIRYTLPDTHNEEVQQPDVKEEQQ